MTARILALDYGTTALKAALYDEKLALMGLARREWNYIRPQPEYLELSTEDYWRETVSAINELLDRFGGRDTLAAVSVTGQAETLIALDTDGRPLGNAIVWLDTRARTECRELAEAIPALDFYRSTGNPGLDPVMPLAKIKWLRAHEHERWAATGHFLLLKEYIVYRLSGALLGEYSVESCSGYFDVARCDWNDELLRLAGVERERLPELRDSRHIAGSLCADARRALSITTDARVVNGLLDQCASGIGAGAIDGDTITETTGTVLAVSAVLDRFSGDTPDMPVLRHALKNRFLALPNCPTAGVLLKWFRDEFLPAGASYDDINCAIAARGRAQSGLMVLPHFGGYFSPVYNPEARGVIYGLRLDSNKWDIAHGIMESVGYLLRENLSLLARHGIAARRVVSLGGGAASPLWMQTKADICGREFITLRDGESTALGCALNAAMALDMIELSDIPALVEANASFTPQPAAVAAYEKEYALYGALNRVLGFNPPDPRALEQKESV